MVNKINIISKILLEQLLNDLDEDGAWVNSNSVKDEVLKQYNYSVIETDFKEVENYLNQMKKNLVVYESYDYGFGRAMVFKTYASKSILMDILNFL